MFIVILQGLARRCNRGSDPGKEVRHTRSEKWSLVASFALSDGLLQFLEIAQSSKILCAKYKVPLIINDRIDIALAVQADGVHLGQTDMPVHVAKSLLPAGTVIGVSCNDTDHVKKAIEDGVDYIGIGAVWGTITKKLTSPAIGVRGVGLLLQALDGTNIKAVAIGMQKYISYIYCDV